MLWRYGRVRYVDEVTTGGSWWRAEMSGGVTRDDKNNVRCGHVLSFESCFPSKLPIIICMCESIATCYMQHANLDKKARHQHRFKLDVRLLLYPRNVSSQDCVHSPPHREIRFVPETEAANPVITSPRNECQSSTDICEWCLNQTFTSSDVGHRAYSKN